MHEPPSQEGKALSVGRPTNPGSWHFPSEIGPLTKYLYCEGSCNRQSSRFSPLELEGAGAGLEPGSRLRFQLTGEITARPDSVSLQTSQSGLMGLANHGSAQPFTMQLRTVRSLTR